MIGTTIYEETIHLHREDRKTSYSTFTMREERKKLTNDSVPWRGILLLTSTLCLAFLLQRLLQYHSPDSEEPAWTTWDPPVWVWDFNVYQEDRPRSLLVTQAYTQDEVVSLTSRPNRAYARQWSRDFALVRSNREEVLEFIVQHEHTISYDAIALLPENCIITNLDFDLLQLLPQNKLVSIVGETILFNLNHESAATVAPTLYDYKYEDLLQAIEIEVDPRLIHHVTEQQGYAMFNGGVVLACENETVALETAASAVCYRYYPKCEVL
jgi:hypothetical protein